MIYNLINYISQAQRAREERDGKRKRERIEKTNLVLEEKSSLEALRHSEPLEPELISDLK